MQQAGGIWIALGLLLGPAIGAFWQETSLGFMIGLGVGVTLALLQWLVQRRK